MNDDREPQENGPDRARGENDAAAPIEAADAGPNGREGRVFWSGPPLR